jgi:hypothetical protein
MLRRSPRNGLPLHVLPRPWIRSSAAIGYVTNLAACPDGTPVTPEFVIGSYHQLFQIEKSFRMSKSDLQARPVYHRKRDAIEAHLTIVLAALAVSRWIEARTGWSIRKIVKTARRYRTIEIQAGRQTLTAADPLPDDLRQALDAITRSSQGAHWSEPTRAYRRYGDKRPPTPRVAIHRWPDSRVHDLPPLSHLTLSSQPAVHTMTEN